jgi:hypothetical protein
MAFYQKDPALFELLDYENDDIFSEPAFFYFFLSDSGKQDRILLLQSIFGYVIPEKRPAFISGTADRFGMINLPNLGYIRTSPNNNSIVDLNKLTQIVPNQFVENSNIRLCLHPTDLLANAQDVRFDESVEQTLTKNEVSLAEATVFFQNNYQISGV